MSITIAAAYRHIEELLDVLDNLYWEASSVERKDAVYAVVTLLHDELSELAKLSIDDHGLHYQPVTPGFRTLKARLSHLRSLAEDPQTRPRTGLELEAAVAAVNQMVA